MRKPDAVVPCNGCTLCCKNELIFLHPEDGDDVTAYETVPARHIDGRKGLALARASNGDCLYLGPMGCTIHGRAPIICKEFDCGKFYESLPASMRNGSTGDPDVQPLIDRGREIFRFRRSSS